MEEGLVLRLKEIPDCSSTGCNNKATRGYFVGELPMYYCDECKYICDGCKAMTTIANIGFIIERIDMDKFEFADLEKTNFGIIICTDSNDDVDNVIFSTESTKLQNLFLKEFEIFKKQFIKKVCS